MNRAEVFTRLGIDSGDPELQRLLGQLDAQAPEDWRVLAAGLAFRFAGGSGSETSKNTSSNPESVHLLPRVIGISGGQGAGKSTLAALLVDALQRLEVRAATGSIDDFYLTLDERRELAATVHPLLVTRGVPGTHDVGLCRRTLRALKGSGWVALPRFDKGRDDRCPPDAWPRVRAPLDCFVLEGWCLGAPPQPESLLASPLNALESVEDPEGHWRRFVNEALLRDYARLWAQVEFWLYLRVPDMAAVTRWRTQQEQDLPADRRMTADQLDRFVAHYERITRWMFETMPERSDIVAVLGVDHRLVSTRVRNTS